MFIYMCAFHSLYLCVCATTSKQMKFHVLKRQEKRRERESCLKIPASTSSLCIHMNGE